MPDRRSPWLRLLCAAALGLGLSFVQAAPAAAQEVLISGPLAGAPAVRHMRLYRQGRFNVAPGIGYTLQDEFARALFVTLEANYHFTEWLGVGLWAGFNPADIDTDLTTQIVNSGQTTDRNRLSLPDRSTFSNQIGRMRWMTALEAVFVPLRGKLSLFQAVFIDTDLYVLGGLAVFGVSERASTLVNGVRSTVCDAANPLSGDSTPECVATATSRADRVDVAPMVGVGMNFYANSWFGLQFEWRAFPFAWNPGGTDESGLGADGLVGSGYPDGVIDGADSRTTFNQMLNVSLVFNLPTDLTVSE